MAQEIEPREYEDVPESERMMAILEEESGETQEEEAKEHGIPSALRKILDAENILECLTEAEVKDVQTRVADGYATDLQSMETYLERYEKIIKLSSMQDETGDKTFPFVGASRVMMPLLTAAAVEFNSRSVPDFVNRNNVVNVHVFGKRPPAVKKERAERRSIAIDWQVKKGIKEWDVRTDRLLLLLPVVGQVFRKKWWEHGEIKDSIITADKMIYDHNGESFDSAPRKSHWFYIDQNEYESCVRREYYAPLVAHETTEDGKSQPKIDEPIKLIESHCTLDLDLDGYCEPYIVTFCECCDTVVKIERRFVEEDILVDDGQVVSIEGEEFFTQCGFIPSFDKPAVYVGWGELLYDILISCNTMMRQMIDAGTLNNTAANSGFISSTIGTPGRTKSQRVELILGQLSKVDVGAGQSLKDLIWTPQFQGVSQSFYQMLKDLVEQTQNLMSASQSLEVSTGEAASLYLARVQQAMKVPNAIRSRVYKSLGLEFQRIDYLIGRYMDANKYKEIVSWNPEISPQDIEMYKGAMQKWMEAGGPESGAPEPKDPKQVVEEAYDKESDYSEDFDIYTNADPSLGGDEERIARAEVIAQRAADVPGYNRYEAEKQFLKAINQQDIETLLPKPTGEPDPMAVLQQQWTQADIERMVAEAMSKKMLAQAKMVETEIKAKESESKKELQENQADKLLSETMKNLHEIDSGEAKLAMETLGMAREDMQMELDAQKELTARQGYKVMEHPEHGEITEADIQKTMRDNNMTRDEVVSRLQNFDRGQMEKRTGGRLPNPPEEDE